MECNPKPMRGNKMIWAVVAVALNAGSSAAEMDLSLHAGDTHTDNVTYGSVVERPDDVAGLAAKLQLQSVGSWLEARVKTDLAYLHYVDGAYNDQFKRGFAGDVRAAAFERRMIWNISDNYGPVLEDPLAAPNPDNWTYDNYFTTGPDFILDGPRASQVIAGLRYGRVDYEQSHVPDSHEYSGTLSWLLAAPANLTRSFTGSYQRVVQRDDTLALQLAGDDFVLKQLYASFGRRGGRTDVSLDAGVSQVSFGGTVASDPLVKASMSRKLSPRLTLSLSGSTQFQGSPGRFQRLQQDTTGPLTDVSDPRSDVVNTASPLKDQFANLRLSFRGLRDSLDVQGSVSRVKVVDTSVAQADQEYRSYSFEWIRQVSPSWAMSLSAVQVRRNFNSSTQYDTETEAYLASRWRLQPKLELALTLTRRERDGNYVNGDFAADTAQLELIYRPYEAMRLREGAGVFNAASRQSASQ